VVLAVESAGGSSGPRVLVTGGAGFFGSRLTSELVRRGYLVRVLDLVSPQLVDTASVEVVLGDVRDRALLDRAMREIDCVAHCVAVQPVSRSRRSVFQAVNGFGTANVLEAALRHGVRRVVHLSSSAVYGLPRELPIAESTSFRPLCDYGRSKVEAEMHCRRFRDYGVDVVILRPRVLLGRGRLGVYHLLFNWIADNKPVFIIGSGDRPFQALAVSDLVTACVTALFGSSGNEDYNLGASEYGTLRGDIEALLDHAARPRRIVPLPCAIAKPALFALDHMDLSPLTAWHYRTADAAFFFDCRKAGRLLDWAPVVSNAQMLKDSYDWYVENRAPADANVGSTHTQSLAQRAFRILKALA
jgi:nucleoside-diphosphate-sugar epimerase